MDSAQESQSESILSAIDGSLPAKAAAYTAIQIATWMQWSLHALYVVDVTQVFEVYSDISQELSELDKEMKHERNVTLFEEQGILALAEIEEMCRKMGVPLTTEMVFGGVADTILKKASGYNLLALGRRGNSHETEEQHLGSNFQQIAHHIHIPMIIGGNITPKRFERILLAYNESIPAHKALTWVENLQAKLTKVMALCVENEKEQDFTWLEDRQAEIAGSNLSHYEFISGRGNPGQMIASTAQSRQTDLILMGGYHHLKLLGWAKHNAFETVLSNTGIPVLATN